MNDPQISRETAWLRIEAVAVRLGTRLFLRGLDWTLRGSEQWAVLGANGAGKSVLAQLLTGQLHPSGGDIVFTPPLAAADIGWVSFELQKALCEEDARMDISEVMETAVDPGTTVGALLAAVARDAAEVEPVARRLGIDALLGRGIRFLSSGEIRRTLIARALLQHPRLVILDNPYEGIDAASRRIMREIVDELLAGAAHVLLLTRQPADIPPAVTHVLALDHGRVVASGPRAAVLDDPAVQQLFTIDNAQPQAPLPVGEHEPLPDGPLIELRDVRAHYGELQVLDGISLRLDRDEHLSIAGPNGCGKSTLLSLICGDNPRAYGQQVWLFGRRRGSGESVWEIKRRFGIVSNAVHLEYPRRASAFAVVASGFFDTLGLYDDCGPRQVELARAWLRLLGLGDREKARFDALSFGEQRMMLIARAMVKSPPVLILDEPCSGLDATNRQRVLALVERIGRETPTRILFVSHEAEEIPRCITRRLEFRRDEGGVYRLVDS